MQSLPPEVCACIFAACSPFSLLVLRGTCRAFLAGVDAHVRHVMKAGLAAREVPDGAMVDAQPVPRLLQQLDTRLAILTLRGGGFERISLALAAEVTWATYGWLGARSCRAALASGIDDLLAPVLVRRFTNPEDPDDALVALLTALRDALPHAMHVTRCLAPYAALMYSVLALNHGIAMADSPWCDLAILTGRPAVFRACWPAALAAARQLGIPPWHRWLVAALVARNADATRTVLAEWRSAWASYPAAYRQETRDTYHEFAELGGEQSLFSVPWADETI